MRRTRLRTWWVVPVLALARIAAASSDSAVANAVKDRNRAALTALLEQHADVNAPAPDGTTALHWAVQWNDVETADLLIHAGAKVDAANRYGATPLWVASSTGSSDAVAMLLKAGANPNGLALQGEPPLTAAARAGSVGAVKALVAHGADVNKEESHYGQTALMAAIAGHDSHPDVVQVLIELQADVNRRSRGGFTALLFAARQGDSAAARMLIKAGANVNDAAAYSGALVMAINNGHADIATLLLESGADPNTLDRGGYTPLHRAVVKRSGAEQPTTYDGMLRVVKLLVALKADLNVRTPKPPPPPPDATPPTRPSIDMLFLGGVTPFWLAASALDIDSMRVLAAAGADPALPSTNGTTPLIAAAGLGQGFRGGGLQRRASTTPARVEEVLTLLLDLGNQVNAANQHGQTAMHGAADGVASAAFAFLVNRGAVLDRQDEIGRTPYRMVDDHRTDKYRSNQNLDPAEIERSWALLRTLGADTGSK